VSGSRVAAGPMVRLERFEKRYGKRVAVKPLDLEIAEGECFALLGPNGGGKTSVLRAIVGLHAPSAGRVLVAGVDMLASPDRAQQQLAYVPQHVDLPGMLSVRETLRLFARLRKAPLSRVDEVLGQLGLEDSADRLAGELSGGMLQRLGLALGFLGKPRLFVLDEPTANLDPPGVKKLNELLLELKDEGCTIVFSSHLLRTAMELADRVGVLVAGEMVAPEEVPAFHAAVTRKTRVRIVLGHVDEGLLESMRAAGGDITSHNGHEVSFTAMPALRMRVIRAIEQAGGDIQEFHTDAPDWETLIQEQVDVVEKKR